VTWKQRYKIKSYLRSSLWIVPVGAGLTERVFRQIVEFFETRIHLPFSELGLEGARALENAVITLTLSFVVFTFGSLLVAIQVASGQYTPRIIATTLLRDNVIRYTVGLFIFTFLFCIRTMNRIEADVPQLAIFVTGMLGLICLAAFLFFIDYAARLLRPVSLCKRVGDHGLVVIKRVYPEKLTGAPSVAAASPGAGPVERTVLQRRTSGVVIAVDTPQLIADAEKANGVIEFAPQVGDFVGIDEPMLGGRDLRCEAVIGQCVIERAPRQSNARLRVRQRQRVVNRVNAMQHADVRVDHRTRLQIKIARALFI